MSMKVLTSFGHGVRIMANLNPPRFDRSNRTSVASSFNSAKKHLSHGFQVSEKEARSILNAEEKRQLELFAETRD